MMNLFYSAVELDVKDVEKTISELEKIGFKSFYKSSNSHILTDNTLAISLKKGENFSLQIVNYVDSLEQFENNPDFVIEKETGRYLFDTPFSFSIAYELNELKDSPALATMSNSDYDKPELMPNKTLGIYGELAQPVENIESAIEFLKTFSFEGGDINDEPYKWSIMYLRNIIIGLHNTQDFLLPTITYFAPDMDKKLVSLETEGVKIEYIDNNKGMGRIYIDGRYPVFLFSFE